jgi:hypothetical protein
MAPREIIRDFRAAPDHQPTARLAVIVGYIGHGVAGIPIPVRMCASSGN